MLYNGKVVKERWDGGRFNYAGCVNCVTSDVTPKDIDPLGMRRGPFFPFIASSPMLLLLLLPLCHWTRQGCRWMGEMLLRLLLLLQPKNWVIRRGGSFTQQPLEGQLCRSNCSRLLHQSVWQVTSRSFVNDANAAVAACSKVSFKRSVVLPSMASSGPSSKCVQQDVRPCHRHRHSSSR